MLPAWLMLHEYVAEYMPVLSVFVPCKAECYALCFVHIQKFDFVLTNTEESMEHNSESLAWMKTKGKCKCDWQLPCIMQPVNRHMHIGRDLEARQRLLFSLWCEDDILLDFQPIVCMDIKRLHDELLRKGNRLKH